MAERIEIRRVQLRRDTALAWNTVNPVLADGEMGIETDTRQFKIGDGVTNWNTLSYGGLEGPPGAAGFVSTDPNNRLIHGTDGGLYVPDLAVDPLINYEQAKA
jgi:hypothetical protein